MPKTTFRVDPAVVQIPRPALDKKTTEGYNISSGEPYGFARKHTAVRRYVSIESSAERIYYPNYFGGKRT